jgi:hypothetical protein
LEAHAPLAGGRACRIASIACQHVSESGPRSAITPLLSAPPAHRRTGRVSQGLGPGRRDTASDIQPCLTASWLHAHGPAILGVRRGCATNGLDTPRYRMSRSESVRTHEPESAGDPSPALLWFLEQIRRRGIPQAPLGHEPLVLRGPWDVTDHGTRSLGGTLDMPTPDVVVRGSVSLGNAKLVSVVSVVHEADHDTPSLAATVYPGGV